MMTALLYLVGLVVGYLAFCFVWFHVDQYQKRRDRIERAYWELQMHRLVRCKRDLYTG